MFRKTPAGYSAVGGLSMKGKESEAVGREGRSEAAGRAGARRLRKGEVEAEGRKGPGWFPRLSYNTL